MFFDNSSIVTHR